MDYFFTLRPDVSEHKHCSCLQKPTRVSHEACTPKDMCRSVDAFILKPGNDCQTEQLWWYCKTTKVNLSFHWRLHFNLHYLCVCLFNIRPLPSISKAPHIVPNKDKMCSTFIYWVKLVSHTSQIQVAVGCPPPVGISWLWMGEELQHDLSKPLISTGKPSVIHTSLHCHYILEMWWVHKHKPDNIMTICSFRGLTVIYLTQT